MKKKSESSLEELDRRISQRLKDKNRKRLLLQAKADSCSTLATTSSSIFSDNSYCESSRRVSFSTAEYREYRITMADSSNSILYPITLDWNYNEEPKLVYLDDSDSNDCSDKDSDINGRRKHLEALSVEKRQQRLLASGMSRRELVALERRRHIQSAGEWASRNNGINKVTRPKVASESILQYYF